MEPIKVNLATFEYYDKRVAYTLILCAAAALLLISAYQIHVGLRHQAEVFEYQEKIDRLNQQFIKRQRIPLDTRAELPKAEARKIDEQVRLVNELILSDVFPWDGILGELERVMPRGIILKSFSLVEGWRRVSLKGHGRSMKEITLFLQAMEASELFEKNVLARLSVEQGPSPPQTGEGELTVPFEIESQIVLDRLLGMEGIAGYSKAQVQSAKKPLL